MPEASNVYRKGWVVGVSATLPGSNILNDPNGYKPINPPGLF